MGFETEEKNLYRMTLEIDPPLLKRTTSYEQWKLETKAWTMITGISREKQAITVALFLPGDHESRIKEKVKTPSIKEKKPKIEELLDDHQNELRSNKTEKRSIIWGELENQIEDKEAMEENIKRNQSGWGIREEDAGVAGMRLSTRALVEGKERQKMYWKIRQLQEIQDSDEIKSCSKQRTLSNSGTNLSDLANQILKLLYCDLKLYL